MDISSMFEPNEKPLDRLLTDGGFTSIFRTIGCVGDSLSSGEFETVDENGKHYYDCYEYSWGQYLARMCGNTVYNFSRGGMTAKWYIETYADEHGFWDIGKACQAYIIALGVNDVFNQHMPLGTAADVNTECPERSAATFAGWYGRIVTRYKRIQPDAKFFFMTTPRSHETPEGQRLEAELRQLLLDFTQVFDNSYVIDLYTYAPRYDADFRKKFYLNGHLNPMGYILTAKMTASYIDYIIRHNMEDFRRIGLIGMKTLPND